jgi:signal transduction histidine kinase
MGGESSAAPINEAVFLLKLMAPEQLESLKNRYPDIAQELQEGIFAGAEEPSSQRSSYLCQRAVIVIVALEEAASRAEKAMVVAASDIKRARSRRLISQVLVLVGSSSLLGAVALDARQLVMVVSAVLTLLAALGDLLAEHYERLLNPKVGNIYDAFQKLGEGTYRARRIAVELQIATQHDEGIGELAELVGKGNELCEQLNAWLTQTLNQFLGGTASTLKRVE